MAETNETVSARESTPFTNEHFVAYCLRMVSSNDMGTPAEIGMQSEPENADSNGENSNSTTAGENGHQPNPPMQLTKPKQPIYKGPLNGFLFCKDCGSKLYYHAVDYSKKKGNDNPGMYTCGRYQIYKACTAHYIRRSVIEKIVLDEIRKVCRLVQDGKGLTQGNGMTQDGVAQPTGATQATAQATGASRENSGDQASRAGQLTSSEQITTSEQLTCSELNELTSLLRRKLYMQDATEKVAKEKEISELKGRGAEIDSIINELYEDKVRGILSSERFAVMLERYENEQK